MSNAIIVGYGVIGKATGSALGIKKYYSRSERNVEIQDIAKYKYIFVCLPTPTVNGVADVSTILDFVRAIHESLTDNIIIIRSTVPPGFNRLLQTTFGVRVVSNPEFLSEDTAMKDAKHPQLIVIGGDESKAVSEIVSLYKGRFLKNDIIVTDSITAELIKYALNTFFSTKVIFANEIADYAKTVKANYETVRKVLESHIWGSKNHMTIWHKGGRGAGGKCLKKDVEAFARITDSEFFHLVAGLNNILLTKYPKENQYA